LTPFESDDKDQTQERTSGKKGRKNELNRKRVQRHDHIVGFAKGLVDESIDSYDSELFSGKAGKKETQRTRF
jgi:hypothetical protein